MDFLAELSWRGLIHQQSSDGLVEATKSPLRLYAGFDPSANSLHVGNLLPIVSLMRAERCGHLPLALVGGATGMIGDPSGKSQERQLLEEEQLNKNVQGVRSVLERFLEFGSGRSKLVNNFDWLKDFGYLQFLRQVGKLFSVNMMLNKESVRARLEDRDQGISYTEFSYMLIQAYDYLWLFENYDCRLQIGGSDQWGNITAGMDLIRRKHQKEAFALTQPLITTAAGQKFGKSEKGAVWLDTERTSPYELFQFFMQADDRDVGKLLRYYTFLDEPTIIALDETVAKAPEKREAQRVLAREVCTMVHGHHETTRAEEAAGALFKKELAELSHEEIELAFKDAPRSTRPRSVLAAGVTVSWLLTESGLAGSKSQAMRDVAGGGIYLNDQRISDAAMQVSGGSLIAEKYLVLRKGKKTYHLICFE